MSEENKDKKEEIKSEVKPEKKESAGATQSKKREKTTVQVDGDVVELIPKRKLEFAEIMGLVIVFVAMAAFYYFTYPSINFQSKSVYWVLFFWILVAIFVISNKRAQNVRKIIDTSIAKALVIVELIIVVFVFVMSAVSSTVFNAKKYASLINITESEFGAEIAETDNIKDIAIMDTATARILGSRTIGSLSDVVSQYEVSNSYSTIDYNGRPMKVATLDYAGLIKWINNRANGIPGYVLVDPVTNEAKYVSLSTPIKYTDSGYFNDNLQRHVQFKYPTAIFEGYYFELDNEGNPYYICPTLKANAGLFGAKDVNGVVICNPCDGECEYYDLANVPTWVDRVFDGDLVQKKYDWYGMLSGGFINSVIGQKGCKVTTDDYGYKVIDGDVYAYTGVTSVNSDESNVGFVLINLRTGDSTYFAMSGAEEYSAMSSAEGQVQNLGYEASFPSIINISGEATYIMALKDGAGLVKMYALVNVQNYNIVATGKTQNEALKEYRSLLSENNVLEVSDDLPSKDIEIVDIQYIQVDGETYVYIKDADGNVYKQAFAENESLILLNVGDKVKVIYIENDSKINQLVGVE